MLSCARRIPTRLSALALTLVLAASACASPQLASTAPSAGSRSIPSGNEPGVHQVAGARTTAIARTSTPASAVSPTPAPPTPTPVPSPQLGPARFSLFTVNPQFTKQDVSFTISQPATVQIRIVPAGQSTAVRTLDLGLRPAGEVNASWDGRNDAGQPVAEGSFSYIIEATGTDGKQAQASYHDLGITYKRMVVSLSQQRLTAYDGQQQFLTTLVTTGNQALPTPVGTFPILGKYHPFTFVSPWPKGSKFYYAPSPVNYALLFDDAGYYVHDSPWRSAYGPGTNARLGTPGLNYTGTHGCVNVPEQAEQRLFNWATIGTVVQVVR